MHSSSLGFYRAPTVLAILSWISKYESQLKPPPPPQSQGSTSLSLFLFLSKKAAIMTTEEDIKRQLINYQPSDEERLVISSSMFNFVTMGTQRCFIHFG